MTAFASAARHIGPAPHRPRRRVSRGPRRLPSAPSLQRCGHLRGAGYSRRATAAHGARRRRRTRRDSDAPVGLPWQTAFVPIRPSARAIHIRVECDKAHLTPRACGSETGERSWIDRDWWRQRFLLRQGHGEEPAKLREAQNSFTGTLARAGDHVSRIRSVTRSTQAEFQGAHDVRPITPCCPRLARRCASNGRSCGATTNQVAAGVRSSPGIQA